MSYWSYSGVIFACSCSGRHMELLCGCPSWADKLGLVYLSDPWQQFLFCSGAALARHCWLLFYADFNSQSVILCINWFFLPSFFKFFIIETRREIQIQQKRSHWFWIHRPCSFGTGSLSSWKPSFTSLQTTHTTVVTKAVLQLTASGAGNRIAEGCWWSCHWPLHAAACPAVATGGFEVVGVVLNCWGVLWTRVPSLRGDTRRVVKLYLILDV